MISIKQIFYNRKYRDAECVQYWKTKMAIKAKVTTAEDGSYMMWLEGEKYPFPGFPRGALLFGTLSPMKHIIKNFIFNDTWALLEEGKDKEAIERIKNEGLDKICKLAEEAKYDMLPPERTCPAVREIYRAFTVVAEGLEGKRKYQVEMLRNAMCYVLQEDDGYRFRAQWTFKFFPKWLFKNYLKQFVYALEMIEHAEIVDDMKERMRLLRRVLKLILSDPTIQKLFNQLFDEMDWKKVRLSKADKYYFRAKWFKCDFPERSDY